MKKARLICLCFFAVMMLGVYGFASELNVSTKSKPKVHVETDAEMDDEWNEELDDEDELPAVWDPLEKLNRGTFYFNDKMYYWCVKPVAKTYKDFIPNFIRTGLLNFFNNLEMPQRTVNCIFQLRVKEGGSEVLSFCINTTVGILGFTKPSENYFKLKCYSEDMGQTFGSYGIGNGIYIVLPFLGSSSLRDLTGFIGDSFLDPLDYIRDPYIYAGTIAVKTVNSASYRLGEYEALKEAAFEPYSAMKDAYIQYRNKQIAQ
ncbi:VacJ family lipoprotein [Candidatus Magnetomorum sp. HK-1]|nr:VacJ family lipoprotein [Candidatus Magnetomorum sp. HK-1]